MENKKKWQMPFLIIGVLLLAYFGYQTIGTFRTAGGSASTKVAAKKADHVKERPPVAEDAEAAAPPTAAAGDAGADDQTSVEELAAIQLPAGDVLRELPALAPPDLATEGPGAPAPIRIGPEIPPAAFVGAPGTPEGALPALGGFASRIRKRGSGFPAILPERATEEKSIRCVGTITGQRRIAILTDLSAADSTSTHFVAEGELIPGPKRLVLAKVEPGSVTIKTNLTSTTLQVEPEAEEGHSESARGPIAGAPPLR